MLHHSVFKDFGSLFKIKVNGEQEKESIICEAGIEKPDPRDHHLSLNKPCDAKR